MMGKQEAGQKGIIPQVSCLTVVVVTNARLYNCEIIYSYFDKGCRIKCMRQPRKVLWVVLSSLFFKEI